MPYQSNLPILDPSQNTGIGSFVSGINAAYAPQLARAQIAAQQAMAQYNTQRGVYYDQYGNLRTVQANIVAPSQAQQAIAKSGLYGSLSDKNVAQTNNINAMTPIQMSEGAAAANLKGSQANQIQQLTAPKMQEIQARAANAYAQSIMNGASPQQAEQMRQLALQAQMDTFQQLGTQGQAFQSQSTQQPDGSVQPQQQMPQQANGVNTGVQGSPTAQNTDQAAVLQQQLDEVSKELAGGQSGQIQAQGYGGKQITYDNGSNFGLWKPNKQDEYISNNNAPPPLPPNTTLIKDSNVDPKTKAKINALPIVAPSLKQMQSLLQDPEVAPYIGKTGPALMKNVEAMVAAGKGNYPEGYTKATTLYRLSGAIIDTLATGQTGSRNSSVMDQFNKAFNPSNALTASQGSDALKSLANTLYDEGKVYVGSNYTPGLRQTAFDGLKQLQQGGLVDISAPDPGEDLKFEKYYNTIYKAKPRNSK